MPLARRTNEADKQRRREKFKEPFDYDASQEEEGGRQMFLVRCAWGTKKSFLEGFGGRRCVGGGGDDFLVRGRGAAFQACVSL